MGSCSKRIQIPEKHSLSNDPFSIYNHVKVTGVFEDGSAEGELIIHPDTLNVHGIVHGGALATLADTVGGWAVFFATGKPCVTVNYAFSFLRPALGSNQKLYCRAEPEKLGGHLCVYRQTITDERGKEVAKGNFTFYLLEHPVDEAPDQPAET